MAKVEFFRSSKSGGGARKNAAEYVVANDKVALT